MSFDAVSSHIRCHFNELLVGLVREVRQLQGLGYRLKPDLSTEVEIAAKFYRCDQLAMCTCAAMQSIPELDIACNVGAMFGWPQMLCSFTTAPTLVCWLYGAHMHHDTTCLTLRYAVWLALWHPCHLQVWDGAPTVCTLLQQHCNRNDPLPEAHDAGRGSRV